MEIEHISVSRKKTYDECPQKYKYHYHLKVPKPGEEPFYFIYGKIIHKIAEVYVSEGAQRSLGEVSTDVLRGKIEVEPGKLAPPLPADYKRRMPEHLRSIQKITEKVGTEGFLERKFRFDLDPPNEKFATGFIDRLFIKGDKAFIIDYKTTKRGPFRETTETVKRDLQLRCYSRVVQKEFGIEAGNIFAALYYLEGGDFIGAKYTEQSLINVEAELLNAYNQIAESNPDRVVGKIGPHCKRCEYNVICPFYRSSTPSVNWNGDMSTLKFND